MWPPWSRERPPAWRRGRASSRSGRPGRPGADAARRHPLLGRSRGAVAPAGRPGRKQAVFEIGRDHPGMRTTTMLERPLPVGRELRGVVTTEFNPVGGRTVALQSRPRQHHQARRGLQRRGLAPWHSRRPHACLALAEWRAPYGCPHEQQARSRRPRGPSGHAYPGAAQRAVDPIALVEGRRYRRDHPPTPPAAWWGLPRGEPQQGWERPHGRRPPSA